MTCMCFAEPWPSSPLTFRCFHLSHFIKMEIALPSAYTLRVKRALLCLLGRNEKICYRTVVSLK